MTEKQWFGPIMAANMLAHVRDEASARKLRLYAVANCRLFDSQDLPEPLTQVVTYCEHCADFVVPPEDLAIRRREFTTARHIFFRTNFGIDWMNNPRMGNRFRLPKEARGQADLWDVFFGSLADASKDAAGSSLRACILATRSLNQPSLTTSNCVKLLRDIFGNPFRPVSVHPHWLTSNVVDLADAIYNERAFDRMPYLADALMDAGCDNHDMIQHCRSPGPHVKGCWVVDLLLGKE